MRIDLEDYTKVCLDFGKASQEEYWISSYVNNEHGSFYTDGNKWYCDEEINLDGHLNVTWAFEKSKYYILENAEKYYIEEFNEIWYETFLRPDYDGEDDYVIKDVLKDFYISKKEVFSEKEIELIFKMTEDEITGSRYTEDYLNGYELAIETIEKILNKSEINLSSAKEIILKERKNISKNNNNQELIKGYKQALRSIELHFIFYNIKYRELKNKLKNQIELIRDNATEYGDETCVIIEYDKYKNEFNLVKYVAWGELPGCDYIKHGLVDDWIVVHKDNVELIKLLSEIGYYADWFDYEKNEAKEFYI